MHKVMTGVTDDVPQWSPPSKRGGSINRYDPVVDTRHVSAMEPTAAGENTRRVLPGHAFPVEAAMEPAAERREQLHGRHQDQLRADAAMEPAIDRREHHVYPGHGPQLSAAGMKPAMNRREHAPACQLHVTLRALPQ
jgi:hypothetical protein